MSEKPEIAHKMQFSIPKLLIIIGIVKNRAELFQVELANKKVCLYSCKLQFIGGIITELAVTNLGGYGVSP